MVGGTVYSADTSWQLSLFTHCSLCMILCWKTALNWHLTQLLNLITSTYSGLAHFILLVRVQVFSHSEQEKHRQQILLIMTPQRMTKSRAATPNSQETVRPPRPRTLLQRLSSGLSSIMPNIPIRKGTLKTKLDNRPKTAPALEQRSTYNNICRRLRLSDSHQQLIPCIEISKLAEFDNKCPYDLSTYHSIPSIHEHHCGFCCGLGPFAESISDTPASSEMCKQCRTRSPFSHVAYSFNRSRGQSRSNSAARKSFAQLFEDLSSSEEGPRIVSAGVTATRTGTPSGRAPLQGGLKTSHITVDLDPAQDIDIQQRKQARGAPAIASKKLKTLSNQETRPVSPKLHHLHGVPGAKDYPFVHKREVDAHIAALRAGSPSTLRRGINEVRNATHSAEITNYSRTVLYGHTTSSSPSKHSYVKRTLSPLAPNSGTNMRRHVEASGSIIIEERRCGETPLTLDLQLENSSVYQRRSPHAYSQQARPRPQHEEDSDRTLSTLITQTPSTVGGKRLELKGGNLHPRLRGGGGPLSVSLGFKLKKWLPTCCTPCRPRDAYDEDSDADLPPPRNLAPERVAKAIHRACRGVALPRYVSQGSIATRTGTTCLAESVAVLSSVCTSSTDHTCSPTASRHIDSTPYFSSRRSDASISRSCRISTPLPSLRGGAGSPNRLPRTLYWLAGGRGKPITMSGWKSQRGKKRTGGLLGMAVFGSKAGTPYEKQDPGELASSSLSSESRGSTSEAAVHDGVEEAVVDGTPEEVPREENVDENGRSTGESVREDDAA